MSYRNNLSYSRIKAVNYALSYAKSPNPLYKYFPSQGDNGGDCTNFVSQCLKAGGAPMVSSHINQWWYSGPRWSISWSVASSLYWYLKISGEKRLYGAKGTEVDSISLLEPGDIIFYKNKRDKIQHSAIITSFQKGYPLISQHTPNNLNISYEKDWAIKMHFVKISL